MPVGSVMIAVFWCLGVVVLALALLRQDAPLRANETAPARRDPIQTPFVEPAPVNPASGAAPSARGASRAGLQAGAALLALAISLDVSGAHAWAAPALAEPQGVQAPAHDALEFAGFDLTPHRLEVVARCAAEDRDLAAYAPIGWVTPPAADGWFI